VIIMVLVDDVKDVVTFVSFIFHLPSLSTFNLKIEMFVHVRRPFLCLIRDPTVFSTNTSSSITRRAAILVWSS
jgi:hypothetical protein